jgi:tyrosyl-tRNA synthetase
MPDKLATITRNLEEVLTRADLAQLVETGTPLRHYIGFEISGKIHLGTGLVCMGKIKDFVDAGVECTVFLADWHSWINDKLGGDRDTIRRMSLDYFAEGLKASFRALGGDPSKLNFVLGTDLYHNRDDYWATVVDVAKNTSLSRMQRSVTILGRKEGESLDFAKLLYPAMQVADIFFQGVNIAHAGIDQRKAHVIARDVASKLRVSPLRNARGEQIAPVCVHHPLLLGLSKPAHWPPPEGGASKDDEADFASSMKMSKSAKQSALFIHDSEDEVRQKVRKAFCPPDNARFNPVLDWARKLIFAREGEFTVRRTADHGGDTRFTSPDELDAAFLSGALHSADLKNAVADWLIDTLAPARAAFASPEKQALIAELDALITR